jgi:hypothetical protein
VLVAVTIEARGLCAHCRIPLLRVACGVWHLLEHYVQAEPYKLRRLSGFFSFLSEENYPKKLSLSIACFLMKLSSFSWGAYNIFISRYNISYRLPTVLCAEKESNRSFCGIS